MANIPYSSQFTGIGASNVGNSRWVKTESINPGVQSTTIAALPDNRALIVGGFTLNDFGDPASGHDGKATNKASLYSADNNNFRPTSDFPPLGPPPNGRAGMGLVLMKDGSRVVAMGGWIGGDSEYSAPPSGFKTEAAFWNRGSGLWTPLAPMPIGRFSDSEGFLLLKDGNVAFFSNMGTDSTLLAPVVPGIFSALYSASKSLVILNKDTLAWAVKAPMNIGRVFFANALLVDGDIFVCGGIPFFNSFSGFVETLPQQCERYSISGDLWTLTDLMPMIPGEDYFTVPPVLDASGNIITQGDRNIFSPGSRLVPGVITLPSKEVLISGGDYQLLEPTGNAGAIASFAPSGNPGTVLLNGVSGMTVAGSLRNWVEVTGAATLANNSIGVGGTLSPAGAFQIVNVLGPTSIEVKNSGAVPADANNGAIVWSERAILETVRKSCIVFDPTAPFGPTQFRRTADMVYARDQHRVARLPNGNILAISGRDDTFRSLANTEEFDVINETWAQSLDITPAIDYYDLDGTAIAKYLAYDIQMIRLTGDDIMIGGMPVFTDGPEASKEMYVLQNAP